MGDACWWQEANIGYSLDLLHRQIDKSGELQIDEQKVYAFTQRTACCSRPIVQSRTTRRSLVDGGFVLLRSLSAIARSPAKAKSVM